MSIGYLTGNRLLKKFYKKIIVNFRKLSPKIESVGVLEYVLKTFYLITRWPEQDLRPMQYLRWGSLWQFLTASSVRESWEIRLLWQICIFASQSWILICFKPIFTLYKNHSVKKMTSYYMMRIYWYSKYAVRRTPISKDLR